jgi:hypothetical protein
MTEFVLRIFFSGLIAFVPNSNGTEMNVVLANTPHEYTLADGTTLPHHHPVLLARAASCEGTCTTDAQAEIAGFLFSNKTASQAQTSLNHALQGGGAWALAGSDLTLAGPVEPLAIRTGVRGRDGNGALLPVPRTAAEREDFTWVADMSEIAPATNGFKDSLTLTEAPPGCTVAARLKLRNGKLFTYSLVKIDSKAVSVYFRKPSGDAPEAPYTQAVANWVGVEIHVPGDSVDIVEQSFNDSSKQRAMKLHPINGVVEIALLNLPPYEAPDPAAPAPTPAPGQHFQVFYDLVKRPPAYTARLVPDRGLTPSTSEPQVDWVSLHPKDASSSELLEQLGLNPRGKGPYDLAICPMVRGNP